MVRAKVTVSAKVVHPIATRRLMQTTAEQVGYEGVGLLRVGRSNEYVHDCKFGNHGFRHTPILSLGKTGMTLISPGRRGREATCRLSISDAMRCELRRSH